MRRKKRLACELTWRISKGFGLVSVDWFLSAGFRSDERTVEREAELVDNQKDKQSNGLTAKRATEQPKGDLRVKALLIQPTVESGLDREVLRTVVYVQDHAEPLVA